MTIQIGNKRITRIIVVPCCCGLKHRRDKDGYFIPIHHRHSIPKGFCEACNCDKCQAMKDNYWKEVQETS